MNGNPLGLIGRVHRIEDVDAGRLWRDGYRGLMLDLDNTLSAYGDERLPDARAAWVADALEIGFAIVIISNNFPPRVEAIAAMLGVQSVPSALKPMPFAFIRALRRLKTQRAQTCIIGDQLLTDMLGARLLGIRGILTEPIVEKDFPLTRVLRFLEKRVFGRKF